MSNLSSWLLHEYVGNNQPMAQSLNPTEWEMMQKAFINGKYWLFPFIAVILTHGPPLLEGVPHLRRAELGFMPAPNNLESSPLHEGTSGFLQTSIYSSVKWGHAPVASDCQEGEK